MKGRDIARSLDLALLRSLVPDNRALATRALPAISTSAAGGKLWLGAAGLLAVTGGHRGRRAALEGVVAVGVTTALVNGPLKQLTRRRRPSAGLGRFLVPRRGRTPRTSSMPSSHAATAAAFAVAAGSSMPVVAAPLALATGAVGWSRVNAGRHFPSDVVAGLVVGAAAGITIHRIAARVRPVESQPEEPDERR